jgi:hypothetical protein
MELVIWILIGILFVGQTALFYLFFKFLQRLSKRFNGHKGKDILKLLEKAMDKSDKLEKNLSLFLKDVEKDRALLRTTLHKVGVVRFNPFREMGGEQSFCVALLDADHNGFIMTSLHTRDGTRVYAKKIVAGQSEHNISAEEEKAIAQALNN